MKGLALQGGGVLGYGQSVILAEIERVAQKPCAALFDIIGGTSVGSINAAHLAAGIPASQLQSFFTSQAPTIFKSSFLNSIGQLWGAKYSAAPIEKALQQCLGDRTLADCKTKFVATSYDWATDRPVYFKSFEKSSETKDYIIIGNDSPIKLWQICRASSAAQAYFPAFKYNGLVLMDGGNIGDNDPDMLILAEARPFIDNVDELNLLSLGAGDTAWKESAETMVNPSVAIAGLKTITIVFSAGESSAVYKASKILGDNYKRISPDLGNGYAIDDASDSTLHSLKVAALQAINNNEAYFSRF
jgi:patatin-like phospholipase/acyl hydrolase